MICHDFFIIFLTFYVAFCAYRPSPIRVAETETLNHDDRKLSFVVS